MQDYPKKDFYRLTEVCQYTDTQPYVLRFWQTEFPQLNPRSSASGQPVYLKRDIEMVRRIKELLYEEEFTLAAARKQLKDEEKRPRKTRRGKGKTRSVEKKAVSAAPRRSEARRQRHPVEEILDSPRPRLVEPVEIDSVPRQRYQAAIEEIDHLRLAVKEAEAVCRRVEAEADKARAAAERAAEGLDQLEELLS